MEQMCTPVCMDYRVHERMRTFLLVFLQALLVGVFAVDKKALQGVP